MCISIFFLLRMGKQCVLMYITFSIAILLLGVQAAPCIHIVGNIGMKNYYSATKEVTWFETLEYCHKIGMKIAVVDSEEEYDIIAKYLRNMTNKNLSLWIGASDLFDEGSFKWITNSKPLNFSNWLNGKPNGGLHRNCVLIYGVTRKWEDQLCTFKFSRPLCEITS